MTGTETTTLNKTEQGYFERELRLISEVTPMQLCGRVVKVIGLVIECEGLSVPVGSLCVVAPSFASRPVEAVVVGFREDHALLMPLGEMEGIKRFDQVRHLPGSQLVPVGWELIGRVVDARGRPIDDGPPLLTTTMNPLYARPPQSLTRPRINQSISTGIRAVDALATCGRGQRLGLFSGSGVGKSLLMGMVAKFTSAQVCVIALVGERGREVRDFIERDLGPEGLRKSVVVVATSDEPPLMRVRAPFTASAIAEFFRDQGADVMLMMDSITRAANAQREIGLSAGEPPTTKGYPPSVFAMMPRLLERAGRDVRGSITGIYTVLVEADDINEPIADTARSILDGHVWLSRDLANRGHYPAIDPLTSISRLMIDVVSKEHVQAATRMRSILATYRSAEDLINIGAYAKGGNPEIDRAIGMIDRINEFLKQRFDEVCPFGDTVARLIELMK
ncbi:MAG: FliI/YscN family ATPase [Planctomycetota bacterium]|nr:FliI/YscN family ATPase [Planctomycetota bacterium]